MTCDDRSDLVLQRSLGGLSPEEDEAARQAIGQDCPPLDAVQAEADATLAMIAGGLAPVVATAPVKAAFLARLAAAKRPAHAVPLAGASVPPAAAPGAPVPAAQQTTSRPAGATPGAPMQAPRAGQPAPRSSVLGTVITAGVAALVAVAMVWAPFQQQVARAVAKADNAQLELASVRQHDNELAKQLAIAEADLKQTHSTLEAKAAAIASQVAELTALLTAAKAEIAKRDARLATGEAALVDAHRDVQHFQDLAKSVSGQIDALTKQHQALTSLLTEAESTITAMRSPQLKVIDLAGGVGQPKAWARLLWDQKNSTWHLLATNMAQLPVGKIYELWFINAAQQKVAAGTFTVDASGSGSVVATIPANIGVLALAAVTDEPVGGVAVPTGSVQLVGTL